jgi:cell volume regulation protein A
VEELVSFGTVVLVVAGGVALALLAFRLGTWFPLPAPAIFLIAAAVASDLFPELHEEVSIRTVERVAVVALIVILFDGGMHMGWRRFRAAAAPIVALGVLGTFATAGVMTLAAHYLFGFSWIAAGLLGAALAPTDPAVTFSVFGKREIVGRTGTILEGESGANDPVGIALMIGMVEFATEPGGSFWTVVREFTIEMTIGLAVGIAGARLLLPVLRRVGLPSEGLYPLRTLAAAGVIYGAATVAHGSGFLAVFVAGILIGDARAPFKAEIERFHGALASLAEIAVFVALGLTIDLVDVFSGASWYEGIVLAAVLALVARPLAVTPLLLPARLRRGEKLFVVWGGLKGAVPILLASFAVLGGVPEANRLYEIVFVVVALSVIVQGSSLPFVAGPLGIPMRRVDPSPWHISVRLHAEPEGVHRFVVAEGGRAAGRSIAALSLGEGSWISMIVRDGRAEQPRGSTILKPGDEVLVLSEPGKALVLQSLFEEAE